jgi:hypothetical protein
VALSTYAELQTSIANWLNRSDLTSLIPDFITLFEARANRKLRVPEMEAQSTTSTSAETLALPSDFLILREIRVDGEVIASWAPQTLRNYYQDSTSSTPLGYAIVGTEILLQPAPGDAVEVDITYLARIENLSSSNTTNWLLEKHPDIYLSASLAIARAYLMDPLSADIGAAADAFIDELNDLGNKMRTPAAQLVSRAAVTE